MIVGWAVAHQELQPFPVARRWAYFDHAAVAPIPQLSHDLINKWLSQALFDGEGHCTAVLRAIMVSLNEETHRSMPFEPAVRAVLDRFAASPDGLIA